MHPAAVSNIELDAEVNRKDRAGRFRLIPFDDLKPAPHPAYLVKGLLPRVGLYIGGGFIAEIINAVIGAVILLVVVRLVKR